MILTAQTMRAVTPGDMRRGAPAQHHDHTPAAHGELVDTRY